MKYILYCFHLFVIKSNVYITVYLLICFHQEKYMDQVKSHLIRSISYNGENKLLSLNL